jgi:hypothetical protein
MKIVGVGIAAFIGIVAVIVKLLRMRNQHKLANK